MFHSLLQQMIDVEHRANHFRIVSFKREALERKKKLLSFSESFWTEKDFSPSQKCINPSNYTKDPVFFQERIRRCISIPRSFDPKNVGIETQPPQEQEKERNG